MKGSATERATNFVFGAKEIRKLRTPKQETTGHVHVVLGTFVEQEALSSAIGGIDVEHSVVIGDTSGIAPRPISLGGMIPESVFICFSQQKLDWSVYIFIESKLPEICQFQFIVLGEIAEDDPAETKLVPLQDKLKILPVQKPLLQLLAFDHHELRDASSSQKLCSGPLRHLDPHALHSTGFSGGPGLQWRCPHNAPPCSISIPDTGFSCCPGLQWGVSV
uniref:Uncharacterized protein n=1 Tax=Solanum lycopersicum TaxID=4081 RepID=A0A3Q7EQE1_SOLLC